MQRKLVSWCGLGLDEQAFRVLQRARRVDRPGWVGWLAGRERATNVGAGGRLKVKDRLQPDRDSEDPQPAAPVCFLIHPSGLGRC